MDDSMIVNMYWNRDENAVRESKRKYGPDIYRLAKRLLCVPEDAEEIENDTYWQAWRTIPPKKPVRLGAYLLRICRNIACNRLDFLTARKRSAIVVSLTEELAECLEGAPEGMAEEDLGSILNDFLREQPLVSRTIFLRRYWYGDSIKSIAGRYHFTESKVKMTLMRTREKLKLRLREEEIWTE